MLVAALREVKGVTEEFPHIGQHVVRPGAVGHDHLEVHGVGVGVFQPCAASIASTMTREAASFLFMSLPIGFFPMVARSSRVYDGSIKR